MGEEHSSSKKAGRQNQRVKLTKMLLKNALCDLAQQKGVDKITISELCQEAGINRSTFYAHYGSQYDVLHEMGDDVIDEMEGALGDHPESVPLSKQIAAICRSISCHSPEARLVFSYYGPDSDFANRLFEARFKDSMKPEGYRPEEVPLVRTFLWNGIYGAIRLWLSGDQRLSADELGALGERITRGIFEAR
ncbi:MAG: TetR/AcrR family transcriptional regulator [Coriobacteriaceae bacterium]|jgi:AcrR family transcriptional regulator|nr:TetR/AcrR family transcriptional regulator [Olsenella sp.]RRF90228.1 MAG: TetR/AcrR family transcriptional regulator [Coriobacteriaceae bacterium]